MRGIIGELKQTGGITVVDMEAGLELFGRGTPAASDLLIVVVEPSLWSIHTAERIIGLARELGIPRLVAIANKVREDSDVNWIRDTLGEHGVSVVAEVPYDEAVSKADRSMRALIDIAPDSPAVKAIAGLVDAIEDEARHVFGTPAAAPAGNGAKHDDGCPWVVDKYAPDAAGHTH